MSVYDRRGNLLTDIYDRRGNSLNTAFDRNGNVVFAKNPLNLKVMTYNVGQWYVGGGNGTSDATTGANYRALQNTILSAQDADILCIQEYWDVIGTETALSMLQQYFPYIVEVNGHTSYFGHAICSKYPISNFVTAPLAKNPTFKTVEENTNTNRFIDRCNITVEGKVLTVFNTHFGLDAETRASNADWLLPLVNAQTNVIVCGDFNLKCLDDSHADYTGVIQKFINSGYHVANCSDYGFIKTYSADKSSMDEGTPTDNIFTSRNILIDDVYVDTTKLTDSISGKIDHLPLIAEVSVY